MKKISKKILASALALAMTVAGSVVTFADPEMPTATESVSINGDTITVTVSAKGDFSAGFDYGVAYDSSKVQISALQTNTAFEDFLKGGQGLSLSNNFAGNYVVFGGATSNKDNLGNDYNTNYDGVIGTVTFKVIEGQDGSTAEFGLIKNTKEVADTIGEKKVLAAIKDGSVPAGSVITNKDNLDTPKPEEQSPSPSTPAESPSPSAPAESQEPQQSPSGESAAPQQSPSGESAAPASNAPASAAPASNAPASAAPASVKPAANTNNTKTNTKSAKTGDAGVVLPIVAICGAAAAVAVASKKKVED